MTRIVPSSTIPTATPTNSEQLKTRSAIQIVVLERALCNGNPIDSRLVRDEKCNSNSTFGEGFRKWGIQLTPLLFLTTAGFEPTVL